MIHHNMKLVDVLYVTIHNEKSGLLKIDFNKEICSSISVLFFNCNTTMRLKSNKIMLTNEHHYYCFDVIVYFLVIYKRKKIK